MHSSEKLAMEQEGKSGLKKYLDVFGLSDSENVGELYLGRELRVQS